MIYEGAPFLLRFKLLFMNYINEKRISSRLGAFFHPIRLKKNNKFVQGLGAIQFDKGQFRIRSSDGTAQRNDILYGYIFYLN